MSTKFTTLEQVATYINSDLIECLECGKRFAFLVNHLRRIHDMDCDEYRESWGIPAMTPLAGMSYRELHRQKIRRMQTDGIMTYDHLPIATAKAVGRPRSKIGVAKMIHAKLIAKLRPGDAHMLPPGAKRADGSDADTARLNQQKRRREQKMNSPTPEEIKLARKAAGLTQPHAAELVYVTRSEWQRWEYGSRKMPRATWELFNLKTKKGE